MRIKSLHIYPVKSTHAVDVTEIDVGLLGLEGYRRWMIVDENGKFITQREYPQLARIQASITAEGLKLSTAGKPALVIETPSGARTAIKVWSHEGEAYEGPADAAAWISDFLGVPARFVWQGDIPRLKNEDPVSFADGYPILIANTVSLADLNSRMSEAVPMNRFRPNIVIECDEPWAEDEWKTIKIGDVILELVKPCERCVVTTTDQDKGVRAGKDPLATMATFRLVKSGDGKGAGTLFAVNAVPAAFGKIRVGDKVEVLARKQAPDFIVRKSRLAP